MYPIYNAYLKSALSRARGATGSYSVDAVSELLVIGVSATTRGSSLPQRGCSSYTALIVPNVPSAVPYIALLVESASWHGQTYLEGLSLRYPSPQLAG